MGDGAVIDKQMIERAIPWLALGFMGIVWGLSFSLGRMAATSGGTALGIAFWQSVISGTLLLGISLARGRSIPITRETIKFFVIIAMLGTAVPGACFYLAASRVQAGVLSITVVLVPILTYCIALMMRDERMSLVRFSGVILGAIAILLLVGPENSLPDRAAMPWVLLACLSSLCYALENIYLARVKLAAIGPIRVACGMNLMAAILLAPTALYFDHLFVPAFPFGVVEWSILGLGLITMVAYTMFVMTIAIAGPLFASQVGYVVTLAGVFWGIYIFEETHSSWVWASLVIMLVGLALVSPRRTTAESDPVKNGQ